MPNAPDNKRMSVALSTDEAEILEWLVKEQGITQKEALRRAIATEAYFYKQRKSGTKILLHTSQSEVKEAFWR